MENNLWQILSFVAALSFGAFIPLLRQAWQKFIVSLLCVGSVLLFVFLLGFSYGGTQSIATAATSPNASGFLPVESMPVTVHDVSGVETPALKSSVSSLSVIYASNLVTYHLDYSMTKGVEGKVELIFFFMASHKMYRSTVRLN